jgi:hypothetical protein
LFFSERWISFSLSVKSVKTRTAFLPDLGSVLTYFEGKKEEFWREKTTTKINIIALKGFTLQRETPLRSHLY